MSDNLQDISPAAQPSSGTPIVHSGWFALPDHQVIELIGADALRFAQSQFMNDVLALESGHWQWNGWLNPKGRVRALFALIAIDAQTLWLLLADTPPQAFIAGLERFRFRSKLAIRHRDDIAIFACGRASMRASGNHWAGDVSSAIDLDWSGDAPHSCGRSLRLTALNHPMAPEDLEHAPSDATRHWAALDLIHGLPRLDASQCEQWTPQQLSLERLSAFSVKKGCYPGQEIVARTHFLGQTKRGLVLLETAQPLAVGDELHQNDHKLGSVISVAGRSALAVLPLPLASEWPLHSQGIACWPRPFAEGLRR